MLTSLPAELRCRIVKYVPLKDLLALTLTSVALRFDAAVELNRYIQKKYVYKMDSHDIQFAINFILYNMDMMCFVCRNTLQTDGHPIFSDVMICRTCYRTDKWIAFDVRDIEEKFHIRQVDSIVHSIRAANPFERFKDRWWLLKRDVENLNMDLFGQISPIDKQLALTMNVEYDHIRKQMDLKLRDDINKELKLQGFTRALRRCIEGTSFYINKFPTFRGYKPSLSAFGSRLDVVQFKHACLDCIRRMEVYKRHYIQFDTELREAMRCSRLENIDALARNRLWIKSNPYVYSRSSIFELPPKKHKVGKTALFLTDIFLTRPFPRQDPVNIALKTYGYLK